ncbi:MAG: Clp1/GlmU family protein [bacterium]|nr:Clp1/GlmU family protein [bacterium]MDE0353323.1 Clp1/GlmU family protein [bacterium]
MGDPGLDDTELLSSAEGVVMIIGAPDSGKTTLARMLVDTALQDGRTVAYIDSDLACTTVGPPTCVGLKWLRSPADVADLAQADDLRFVGSIRPDRFILQQVAGVASLVESVREEADLVVIDTSGTVSGVVGQRLKYHKAELVRPDTVWAVQRGGELEPLVGLLRRFLSANVVTVAANRGGLPMSPEERMDMRAARFAAAFPAPLQRWRVLPTVFAPSLPAGFDLVRLHRMIVGVHDRQGRCLSLGMLEYDDVLRVITSGNQGMAGLQIGSVRLDPETFRTTSVRLNELMFGLG